MKRNSRRFLRLLPLLLGLSFIATPFSVRGQQSPQQPSRAGIYEGHVFMDYGKDRQYWTERYAPFLQVILEFNDDGPGRYIVSGQIFDTTKAQPIVRDSLKGWFDGSKNVVEVDVVNDPKRTQLSMFNDPDNAAKRTHFRGGFEKEKDGREYLALQSSTVGSFMEHDLILFRQENPPPKVSQGSLAIESAVVDPAETERGKPVTLRYEYRATDIIDTA